MARGDEHMLALAVIPANAGIQCPKQHGIQTNQVFIQILPFWIHLLDQFQFPLALPFLERLLPSYRGQHVFMLLVPDQVMHTILFRETFD